MNDHEPNTAVPPAPIPPVHEIGVLVVDDNHLLGESLERWLGRAPGVRCVAWTDDAQAVEALVEKHKPEVLLLDVDIPGANTFALLRRLTAAHPQLKTVMLSGHVREDYIERALDEGAAGYIVKDESPTAIINYVRRAVAGEIVLSPTARVWLSGPP